MKSLDNNLKPVLKWAGGKTQLLSVLTKRIPKKYNKFIEPFIGGGALFFYLNRPNSIIADTNGELINLYTQLSKNSKKIITKLKEYKNTKDFFYEIRKKIPNSNIDRACRTIFLNKTCFNGLYRVNKKGEFNVPYGNNKTSNFIDEENLKLVEKLLKKTKIVHSSYEYVLNKYAEKNDFIFLDPPYYPVSKYSDFKRYTKEQFSLNDQIKLSKIFYQIDKKNCYLILTNSEAKEIINLYKDYKIELFNTKRNINSIGSKRTGKDIIVTNY